MVRVRNIGLLLVTPKQAGMCSISFFLLIAHTWSDLLIYTEVGMHSFLFSFFYKTVGMGSTDWSLNHLHQLIFGYEAFLGGRKVGRQIGKALRQY